MSSALALTACLAVIGLLLLPYAMGRSGSAGPIGVAAAAAISLVSAWASEGIAYLFLRTRTPLAGLLMGMAARMAPPLMICLILAAQGASGRQHLPFVVYLLAFYVVTLALETWFAVKRVPQNTSDLNHGAR